MTSPFVRNLLNEQRRRLTGTVMQYMENNVYDRLSVAEQQGLRRHILAAISAYHDVSLDILKASVNDGTIFNEDAVRLLEQIHSETQALVRKS